MDRIRLIKHFGVKPYIVFDGGLLPSKMKTEKDREKWVFIAGQGSFAHIAHIYPRKRADAIARAKSLAVEGKRSQARDHYVKAVDVTPQMAYQLIKVRFLFYHLHLTSYNLPFLSY
jgi:exonuclease 1